MGQFGCICDALFGCIHKGLKGTYHSLIGVLQPLSLKLAERSIIIFFQCICLLLNSFITVDG